MRLFCTALSLRGNIWRFGQLNRSDKQVVQDLNLYRIPADIKELLEILLVILTGQVAKAM